MAKQLALDPKRCVDCKTCVLMCSFGHHDVFNPRLSSVTVFDFEEQAISVPLMCLQCEESSCVKVCPTGALELSAEGVVTIAHPGKCIVCKMCIQACPLGNISFSPITKKVFKCDLCGNDEPQCALFCPTGAITVTDPTMALKSKRDAADKLVAALEEVQS